MMIDFFLRYPWTFSKVMFIGQRELVSSFVKTSLAAVFRKPYNVTLAVQVVSRSITRCVTIQRCVILVTRLSARIFVWQCLEVIAVSVPIDLPSSYR